MPRNSQAEAAAAKALSDPDATVLAAAVRTVGSQRQAGKVEQVQPLLEHADAGVRAAAVEALASLGGSRVVIPISRRLKEDSSPDVRVAAAKALGELGGPHAPGALGEAAKKDPDSRVQHVALESLRRLGFR
jgi:HEAT repeat protein